MWNLVLEEQRRHWDFRSSLIHPECFLLQGAAMLQSEGEGKTALYTGDTSLQLPSIAGSHLALQSGPNADNVPDKRRKKTTILFSTNKGPVIFSFSNLPYTGYFRYGYMVRYLDIPMSGRLSASAASRRSSRVGPRIRSFSHLDGSGYEKIVVLHHQHYHQRYLVRRCMHQII